MSNVKLLKILNPIMAIAFLSAAIAIILLKYSPIAALKGNEIVYLIHVIGGKLFILLALCHITLNWAWIRLNILGIKPKSKAAKKTKRKK